MGVVSAVNFLQQIEKLKKTNADSSQVKILMLRQKVADLKSVREKHESVRMPDSVCHIVAWAVVASRCWQWGVNMRG